MKHEEFRIGGEFITGASLSRGETEKRWRCTDIGTRTIVAIQVDHVTISTQTGGKTKYQHLNQAEAEAEGWFGGPPYMVAERVFDEDDQCGCQPHA
jgi:hypothetical protein